MAWSPALSAYLGLTSVGDGYARRLLAKRKAAGKEDPQRINERFGRAEIARPQGPLIWFHAASVGESLSILELLRAIRQSYPDLTLLVTTGTRTSAQLLSMRLPKGVLHQYVPVDTETAVAGFLDHWRPSLGIWTESELWPRIVTETAARGVPMVLVNGRMSERSAKRWCWFPGMAKRLVDSFDLVLVQDDAMAARFRQIGTERGRLVVTGSLKEGAVPLPDKEEERKLLQAAIGTRPVWLAASTHAGEEAVVVEAHRNVRAVELLLILAPRHPERGTGLATWLRSEGFAVAQRSAGEPLTPKTDIYLADTLGEMGLWYRLAPVSFVGGSLEEIGGHNPFEPAALGSAILHGPHVGNFLDIYRRLANAGATMEVTDAATMSAGLATALEPDTAAALAAAAWDVASDGATVTEDVMGLLDPFLKRAQAL